MWVLLPWAVFVVVNVISMPLFNSDAYKNQLTEPEEKVFSSDMQAIDVDSIPVVDKALAAKLADKKLGEKPSLGSQVVLGEPVIQTVNEELVWVVPLYHSGLFKWVSNMDGSDGYIVVSATNMRDVEYVEGYKIKYQPNAYLFDNLQRKIRFSGGFFTGIDDFSFELDDTGRPYWVVTTYRNSWGFSLPEADGIILLDAQTGETHRYGLDEIPEWWIASSRRILSSTKSTTWANMCTACSISPTRINSARRRGTPSSTTAGAATCSQGLPVSAATTAPSAL